VQGRFEEAVIVAAFSLGAVHCRVRIPDQRLRIVSIIRKNAYTNAATD
jgi:hypothetical protein